MDIFNRFKFIVMKEGMNVLIFVFDIGICMAFIGYGCFEEIKGVILNGFIF